MLKFSFNNSNNQLKIRVENSCSGLNLEQFVSFFLHHPEELRKFKFRLLVCGSKNVATNSL